MPKRKVILYISMSVDGFIATQNDDISWLSIVEKQGEDYGYGKFIETIDTYIVGRKTHEKIMELTNGNFPQTEALKCFVITRQKRENEKGINFYNGDIESLITQLKNESGKNIYCDGGGEIIKLLMEKDLIDEYIISIIPIILGDGKRLFKGGISQLKLKTLDSKQYDTGLIQLHYAKE